MIGQVAQDSDIELILHAWHWHFNTFRNIAGLEVVDYRMNLDAWLEFYSVIYGKQV